MGEQSDEIEALQRQDEERRRVMATVAHDMRTPLTTIQGYVNMLQQKTIDDETRDKYLRVIAVQCQRLYRLTQDVSFLARQADAEVSWNFEKLQTAVLFARAEDELMPQYENDHVALATIVGDGAEQMRGDDDRLMQVLTNLLGNAVKFAPRDSEVQLEARREGASVLISVTDKGLGVAEEHREEIFERYQSSDETGRGEGIGLWVCRDIARAHDGEIWVEETPGGGARFVVRLPDEPRTP